MEINSKLRKRNFSSVSSEKISDVVKMAIKRELKEPIGTDYVTLNSAKNIKKSLNKINIFSRKTIINNLNESYPESYFDLNFFSLKFNKRKEKTKLFNLEFRPCLLYTSPSPRD